jgi:hypothetical protein
MLISSKFLGLFRALKELSTNQNEPPTEDFLPWPHPPLEQTRLETTVEGGEKRDKLNFIRSFKSYSLDTLSRFEGVELK